MGLVALVYSLQELANNGFDFSYTAPIILGTVFITIFMRRQKKSENPLVDLKLFNIASFSKALVILATVILVTAGTEMLFAQHLQVILGLSPVEAGLLFVIPAVLSTLGTLMAPVLIRWMKPASAIILGFLFSISGSLIIVFTIHDAEVFNLIVGVSLIGFGGGPAMTLTSEKIVASVPQEKAGSASALSDLYC